MLRQILTALVLAALPVLPAAAEDEAPAPPASMAGALAPALQPGDLVFKGASTALWTELAAQWSTGDRRWGHVGIVISAAGRGAGPVIIVHADTGTGDPAGETVGEVRAVPLQQFLGMADQAGIYRLALSGDERARMVAWAEAQATHHIPFDRGYSLASANNLYCTELVWRALSEALGRDAIPDKSTRMGRTYIALSDLSTHPLAEEIMELDWRE